MNLDSTPTPPTAGPDDTRTEPGELKRLSTRRGDFYVPHYHLWSEREQISGGAGVLQPGASVALVGSCIVRQAELYLRRRGYSAFHSPGGYHYNPQAIRVELERVFKNVPWPVALPLEIPGNQGFAHPFRKNLLAASPEDLSRRDEEISEQMRSVLRAADVIICVIGTTVEVWRSGDGGVAINEIPHPEIFNRGGWEMDLGNLDEIRAEVRAIVRLLSEHTRAAQVYAICPIPLYATWADDSVVTMNGRGKALMRTALEQELADSETYLPMWDWMQAQTRRWSPTRPDGRHLDWGGVDRLMHFSERYLAVGEVPELSLRHRVGSALKDAGYRFGLPGTS